MKNKRVVFFTFLLSYFLLAVIIIVILSAVYNRYISIAKKSTEQYNILQLEKNIDSIDKTLEQVELGVNTVSNMPFVEELAEMSGTVSIYELYKMQEAFKAQPQEENCVVAQYITLRNSNSVVARINSNESREDYFGKTVIFEENMYDFYQNIGAASYTESEKNVIINNAVPYRVIVNIRRIKGKNSNEPAGYITTLIDTDVIRERLLTGFNTDDFCIIDKNGKVLMQNGDMEGLKYNYGKMTADGDNVIFALKSSYNSWTYLVKDKENYIFNSVIYMRNTALVFILTVMVFAAVIGVFFSHKNAKPILKILDLVENDTEENAYESIYSYISLLKHDINDLHGYLTKNSDFIQGGIIKKIFDGTFESKSEFLEQCSYTGIDFDDKIFWITVIKSKTVLNGSTESQQQDLFAAVGYSILDKCTENYSGVRYFILCTKPDTMAVLFYIPRSEKKSAEKYRNYFEKQLTGQLRDKFAEDFYVQTGKITDNPMQIAEIYNDSEKKLRELKDVSEKEEIFVSDYWFPIDFENKLINVISNGITEEFENLKEKFFMNNKENLNKAKINALYSELKGTLVKVLKIQSLDISAEVISVPQDLAESDALEYIFNLLGEICEQNFKKKKSKDTKLYEEMKYFITKNYWNQDMSLSLLGERFNMSEAGVSLVFKKNGDNYVAFLEKVRLENACKLLLSERIKMVEVAEIVGYNSDQSFRRAFKRCYGITPKEYKELYEMNNKNIKE